MLRYPRLLVVALTGLTAAASPAPPPPMSPWPEPNAAGWALTPSGLLGPVTLVPLQALDPP